MTWTPKWMLVFWGAFSACVSSPGPYDATGEEPELVPSNVECGIEESFVGDGAAAQLLQLERLPELTYDATVDVGDERFLACMQEVVVPPCDLDYLAEGNALRFLQYVPPEGAAILVTYCSARSL